MTEFFYIFDDVITSLEVVEVDGRFYLDEDLEIQVIFESDNTSHYASWWEGCDDEYTSVEVFVNRDDAVSSLRDSLRRRIDCLQQKLAALE
jgi:hypothetical protein